MSTGIFMPMTKCVHDIPYHGWTHETNSSSSLVFICDILNSRNLNCVPCSLWINSFYNRIFIYMYDGYYDYFIVLNGQKTRNSNSLQLSLKRKYFLHSYIYLKILICWFRVWTYSCTSSSSTDQFPNWATE